MMIFGLKCFLPKCGVVAVLGVLCFSFSSCKDENAGNLNAGNSINLHQNPEINLVKKADGLWVMKGGGGMKVSDDTDVKYFFDVDSLKTYVFQKDGTITVYEVRANGDGVIYGYDKPRLCPGVKKALESGKL